MVNDHRSIEPARRRRNIPLRAGFCGLGLAMLNMAGLYGCTAGSELRGSKALAAPLAIERAGPVVPTQEETLAWLRADRFDELEARFDAIQGAYKRGDMSDEQLNAAFLDFNAVDPALDAHYLTWVHHSDHSYVAHLARGIYYEFIGLDRRGGEYISKTSNAQIVGMQEAFATASAELRRSMSLDDQPLLSDLYAMDIAGADGNPTETRRLLDLANHLAPHNFIVRERYMRSLQTRWDGSVEQMQAFLAECALAPITAAQRQALEALTIEDQGWVEENVNNDVAAAIQDYAKAGKMSPDKGCLPCGPLGRAADLMRTHGQCDQAIPLYNDILRRDPKDVDMLNGRAYCEVQQSLWDGALGDLRAAVNMNNAYAQYTLATLYLTGRGVPIDQDAAADLLRKAAAQDYAPAVQLLPAMRFKVIPRPAGAGTPGP